MTDFATWADWFAPAARILPKVAERLPEGKWGPNDTDRAAAWTLYTQLRTRISSAPLRYRDGVEVTALESIVALFRIARDLIEKHGRTAGHFATPTVLVLELTIRPFTAHWHKQSLSGALARQDTRRRFRRELRVLRDQLDAFAQRLGALADGAGDLELPHATDSVRTLDTPELWPMGFIGPRPAEPRCEADIAAEIDRIRSRRRNAYASDEEREYGGLGSGSHRQSLGLVGLCLSGGGIRSATFCLGAVQSLARHGIFNDVDYLSTVSGGGYLGAFLASHLDRSAGQPLPSIDSVIATQNERTGDSRPVRWLRNNTKYLLAPTWRERLKTIGHLLKAPLPGGKSWHTLYRDRVAATYVNTPIPKLSALSGDASGAPYLLINAAVNLPGSTSVELRGRRSDLFVFTRDFVGSPTTGYCRTLDLENADDTFNLATAMAISGAAVSPQMGSTTRRFLTPFLAMANLDLSYWLPNPLQIAKGQSPTKMWAIKKRWKQMTGAFDENDGYINLSDGGHVENLGLYELLRRRCRLIIAVDGECDRGRTCGALIKASRLAAIDMGVRIDIDLSELAIDDQELSQAHFAFGTIDYGENEHGYLVYIKSAITGNEPSFVLEYRARHPRFPHETTLDQLFDEDQFEAYRALGEHSADDLFGEDFITAADLQALRHRARHWLGALTRELLS